MIAGHGIDLVSVARIEKALERHPERFARKILSASEHKNFVQRGSKANDLAKYFAAKEAAAKALGTGMGAGVYWPQLQLSRKSVSGAPLMSVHGAAAVRLKKIGGDALFISLADEGDLVFASVVIAASEADGS